jgi:hypothetical protein
VVENINCLIQNYMKINKKVLAITAMSLIGVLGLASLSTVSAYQGDYTKQGPNFSPERHEIMIQAMESNNYNLWKELMNGRGRVIEVINENNFSQFVKAHQLAKEGKHDEASKIREELGLRTKNGKMNLGSMNGINKRGLGRVAK